MAHSTEMAAPRLYRDSGNRIKTGTDRGMLWITYSNGLNGFSYFGRWILHNAVGKKSWRVKWAWSIGEEGEPVREGGVAIQ